MVQGQFPQLDPEIVHRDDILTDTICQVLHKAYDLPKTKVVDFWSWIWPAERIVRLKDVLQGPVARNCTEDICARPQVFNLIHEDQLPQWFVHRMRK